MGFTSIVHVGTDLSNQVAKALREMTDKRLLIGIPETAKKRKKEPGEKQDPIGNAALLYIQENGSAAKGIPPRPVLQPGVEDSLPKVTAILKVGGEKTLEGTSTIDKTLGLAGTVAVASVKNRITQSIGLQPLMQATIDRRKLKTNGKKSKNKFANEDGSANERPLLDTAQMMNSITYVIDKG